MRKEWKKWQPHIWSLRARCLCCCLQGLGDPSTDRERRQKREKIEKATLPSIAKRKPYALSTLPCIWETHSPCIPGARGGVENTWGPAWLPAWSRDPQEDETPSHQGFLSPDHGPQAALNSHIPEWVEQRRRGKLSWDGQRNIERRGYRERGPEEGQKKRRWRNRGG